MWQIQLESNVVSATTEVTVITGLLVEFLLLFFTKQTWLQTGLCFKIIYWWWNLFTFFTSGRAIILTSGGWGHESIIGFYVFVSQLLDRGWHRSQNNFQFPLPYPLPYPLPTYSPLLGFPTWCSWASLCSLLVWQWSLTDCGALQFM